MISSPLPPLLVPPTWKPHVEQYRGGLLNDVIPFWLKHASDPLNGGYCFAVGRDGSRLDPDKGVWQQGRFAWMLSTLYREVEPRSEWLAAAKSGVDFLLKHGFDTDGRMFFLVTSDGRPLRKRRYFFSETFTIMALAAYGRAAQSPEHQERAVDLYRKVLSWRASGVLPAKVDPRTRPLRGLAVPMILLCTAQVLRDTLGLPQADEWAAEAIREIETYFVRPDLEAVLETVGANGEPLLDSFDGRLLNPGHAIEAAWFILHESTVRSDPRLRELGLRMLDWMWVRGWDRQEGGILYFRDIEGRPVQEYWHDMKFWWPHNEALIATLLAWRLTGDPKYASWYEQTHEWTYRHFPDPEYGEWFGYLHRDGRVSVDLKGNHWKGGFHLPRMQLYCWKLLEPSGFEST